MFTPEQDRIDKRRAMAKRMQRLADDLRSPKPKIDLGGAFSELAEAMSCLLENLSS